MSEITLEEVPTPAPELSRKAAIVGVGETDYHADYQAARAGSPQYEAPTPEGLAKQAVDRAMADAGLEQEEVDGLSVSFIYGGPDVHTMAQVLGLNPDYRVESSGILAGPLQRVCADIAAGLCDTVVMVYAAASRAIGRQYGGNTYASSQRAPSSYYYFHPWGWSSQAAHWAFIFSHYQSLYGVREEDLGSVAVQLRQNARLNPNAVMQKPMTIDDYMQSRYIVRPLHLFDMCLVNDGAVCLIVRRSELAKDMLHAPVQIAGWGESIVKADKMNALVRERLRKQLQESGSQALEMAGLALADITHAEFYDPSTIHLVNQLEGYGFTEAGQGLEFCKAQQMAPGGRLPVNVGGGMLSGSYMHGWSHVAEITRQLRHESGTRQVEGVQASLFSVAQTDRAHPVIFTRGA